MKLNEAVCPELRVFADKCVDCGLCLKGCIMSDQLEEGPGKVVSHFLKNGVIEDDWAFRCSLCGYCSSVCPVGADLRSVMTALRKRACAKPSLKMRKLFAGVLAFQFMAAWEHMGTPPVFPKGKGRRLFFPGCALASSDPELVLMTWRELRSLDSDMGIMVGCCGTPAASLGRDDVAEGIRSELAKTLMSCGVEEIVVACPNCLKALSSLPVKVSSIWGCLGGNGSLSGSRHAELEGAMFHSPCPLRDDERELAEVERLAEEVCPSIRTDPYGSKGGLCCGAGGMVPIVHPEVLSSWSERISRYRRNGETVVCCCQSCVDSLGGGDSDVVHLLRLMLGGASPPPPTGLSRWTNRRKLRRAILDDVE
ncbi:(Fe-S)-binding protein [Dethiosulfovibrio sp. F2B]|uniref:(Fe-S)-binding protein n=1 Tax=Dethiosulfovibrio faecalis TaxID=2720018 RepID=UPI001F1B4CBC|nr:(Fe-S)-binding protein [Dethiosulfovibrio faecalis]MCF4151041.1 (Fe-S)-binding protein [Dethiosulfovibrio faecalis]